jgi:hypothetical protein
MVLPTRRIIRCDPNVENQPGMPRFMCVCACACVCVCVCVSVCVPVPVPVPVTVSVYVYVCSGQPLFMVFSDHSELGFGAASRYYDVYEPLRHMFPSLQHGPFQLSPNPFHERHTAIQHKSGEPLRSTTA